MDDAERDARIEEIKREMIAEMQELGGQIGNLTRSETLDAARNYAEDALGVPCVAQFSDDGKSIVIQPALRPGISDG